ncbi:DUF6629 family protein [Flavobacterium lacustre]|uniref:DUF6629 family protein n=1 Tax=Flavobacterium lacustre TaxID=3016339 RepID=UPI0022B6107A|nr:DUF6629 family protein [Flavobacterium lacustre]
MCFSANASFGAGIILSVIGIASIKKTEKKAQIYFACIPLLFCVQQVSEGFLWLSLTHPSFSILQKPSTYFYLFFAQVVWPILIPFALLKLEEEKKRKIMLRILVGIGLLVSLYLSYCLLFYTSEAKITGYHIRYQQDYPIVFGGYGDFLYSLATIAPAVVSSIKRMWLLSITILVSYLITLLFYVDYIISVWCFFAAIISIMVLYLLNHINKKVFPDHDELHVYSLYKK